MGEASSVEQDGAAVINPFRRKDEAGEKPEAGVAAGGEKSPGAGDAGAGGAGGGGHGGDVDETAALIEQLEREVAALRAERDAAAGERDQAQAAWKHALADFQNFQRRAAQNEQTARDQAVRGVLHSILPVIDHFEMALTLNPEASSARQVMDGVSMIKGELLRAISLHGVQVINPQAGEPFDAGKHKAIAQQPAPGVAAGHVAHTARIGYALEGRVIRPAEVLVAAEEPGHAGNEAGEADAPA